MIAAVAAGLLLSACWSGPPLFTSADTVAGVVADGDYMLRQPGPDGMAIPFDENGKGDVLRARNQRDGSLRVTGSDKDVFRVRTISLIDAAGRYGVQIEKNPVKPGGDVMYVLLDTRPTPARVFVLPCDREAERVAAQDAGASCVFRDAATLHAQLSRIARARPQRGEYFDLIPVPKR